MAPSTKQNKIAKVTPTKAARKSGAKVSAGKLRGTHARICCALAELDAMGIQEPTKDLVAIMAEYPSENSAGFKKAVGEAKKAGFVLYPADKTRLGLSQSGIENTPIVQPVVENTEMLKRLKLVLEKRKAPKKAAQVLDMLSNGGEYTYEYIAKQVGYPDHNTPGFKKFIGSLTSLPFTKRLASKGSSTTITLTDFAFPQGRGASKTPAFRYEI